MRGDHSVVEMGTVYGKPASQPSTMHMLVHAHTQRRKLYTAQLEHAHRHRMAQPQYQENILYCFFFCCLNHGEWLIIERAMFIQGCQ